jgi:hypothetical protein
MVCSGVNFRALASFTGRHQLGRVVRIDHKFLGRSVMEDLICLDCPLQRDHVARRLVFLLLGHSLLQVRYPFLKVPYSGVV